MTTVVVALLLPAIIFATAAHAQTFFNPPLFGGKTTSDVCTNFRNIIYGGGFAEKFGTTCSCTEVGGGAIRVACKDPCPYCLSLVSGKKIDGFGCAFFSVNARLETVDDATGELGSYWFERCNTFVDSNNDEACERETYEKNNVSSGGNNNGTLLAASQSMKSYFLNDEMCLLTKTNTGEEKNSGGLLLEEESKTNSGGGLLLEDSTMIYCAESMSGPQKIGSTVFARFMTMYGLEETSVQDGCSASKATAAYLHAVSGVTWMMMMVAAPSLLGILLFAFL